MLCFDVAKDGRTCWVMELTRVFHLQQFTYMQPINYANNGFFQIGHELSGEENQLIKHFSNPAKNGWKSLTKATNSGCRRQLTDRRYTYYGRKINKA